MLSYDECGSNKLPPTVILKGIKQPIAQLNNDRNFLTTPSTPAGNNGLDNINGDLICYENQELFDKDGRKFRLIKWVGQGHFGQVYECSFVNNQSFQSGFKDSFKNAERKDEKKRFAIKISKSSSDALSQFSYESEALFYVCII